MTNRKRKSCDAQCGHYEHVFGERPRSELSKETERNLKEMGVAEFAKRLAAKRPPNPEE